MGVHPNITHDSFPKQSTNLSKRVRVTFHYDTARTVGGVLVRDDMSPPWVRAPQHTVSA